MRKNAVAWAALIVSSVALLSSTGALRTIPAAPKVTPESQKTAKALSEAFEAVADFVRPSVVQISVTKKAPKLPSGAARRFQFPGPNGQTPKDFEEMLKRFFGPEQGNPENEQFGMPGTPTRGVGSGFVYDANGHILTNNHVVENADKISVKFHDGTEVHATVVGADKQTDVAVIKIDNTSYPPIPKGDSSKLRVGELVMAVGSPFELSQTVTTGIISALNRNNVRINDFESFIQTDAPINRGNSGGPLVNLDGEVIGINSAIVTGGSSGNDGIGFAIPIKLASTIADMLIKDGKVHFARIGIELNPLTPALARQLGLPDGTKGIMVGNVVAGSPADKAGLKQGDVIIGFAGENVADPSTFRLKVATSAVSKPYDLEYIREGVTQKTRIVPAPQETVVFDVEREGKSGGSSESPKESATTAFKDFGLEVQPLTAELAKSLGVAADKKGLLVTSVTPGSPAEAAGVAEGDVISKIIHNHKIRPLTSVKDFQDMTSKTDEVAVYIEKEKGRLGAFVTLSKAAK